MDREIYTEISEPSYIAYPPQSLRINDVGGMLKNNIKNDPESPVSVEVYVHSAHCTNPQSRSLGADFDGYIRITIKEGNTSIARAQMDYKSSPERENVQQVYEHLIQKLQWQNVY
ncbi:MAG TPA: hypothetical protein VJA83_10010 [Sulfuricurvum sp.]|nr:hypothetical protein [Sulfuricurvum sp.]